MLGRLKEKKNTFDRSYVRSGHNKLGNLKFDERFYE